MRGLLSISSVLGLALVLAWHEPVGADTTGGLNAICTEADERLHENFTQGDDSSASVNPLADEKTDQLKESVGADWGQAGLSIAAVRAAEGVSERRGGAMQFGVAALHPARGPPGLKA
ncbi:MAG: hypothetical protein RIQ79_1999 [Verrucomicrobiota bacterium]